MLTNPEAATAASDGIARYQAQIAAAIPADPAEVIRLLRPCVRSLAARPGHSGPP